MFSSNSSQVSSAANYIENVFSTYLYTGNGSTQSINNGIDLSTYGGMVWAKDRSVSTYYDVIDTVRGGNKSLSTNVTDAQYVGSGSMGITSFNTNGMTLGNNIYSINSPGNPVVSWTFRKQPKFFDVQTFTTDATGAASFSHNLGSTPGCVIVKTTAIAADWFTWHSGLNGGTNPNRYLIKLNTTAAQSNPLGATDWITPTSTTVSFPSGGYLNGNATYVAYIFASNAGGFGLTGTDNVITCGSFTTDSSGYYSVNLGYEPQWVLIKPTSTTGNWILMDTMRGFSQTGFEALIPNTSSAAFSLTGTYSSPNATGFSNLVGSNQFPTSNTFIYIAIRRGPMAVPTTGTSVFATVQDTSGNPEFVTTFPVDTSINTNAVYGGNNQMASRLIGAAYLQTNRTNAEAAGTGYKFDYQNGFGQNLANDPNYYAWNWRRAPSFFDQVCYTGDGTNMTLNHNLGVAPELLIVKRRSAAGGWFTYSSGTTTPNNYYLQLQTSDAQANAGAAVWNNTSTTFLAGTGLGLSSSGYTYVAYLFATCPGVSKVGSYTGNGTTQAIACGFTGGARFVLIKRTDTTGDWYVYDTARGMTTLTDPYILLDSTSAETATLGSVTTTTGGFTVNASILSAINTNAANYIFLAIS